MALHPVKVYSSGAMSPPIFDRWNFGLSPGVLFRPFGRPRRHRAAPRRGRCVGTFLYVLQGEHGLTKIGVSKNPNARLRQLRTASAFPIDFAYVAATPGTGFDIERKAHATLAAHRLHGEWFDVPAKTAVAAVRDAAYRLRKPLRPIRAGTIANLQGPAWPNGTARLLAAACLLARALIFLFEGFAGAMLAVGILLMFIKMDSRKVDRVPSILAQRVFVVPLAHLRPSRGSISSRPDNFGRP
jgi:hypothetical protein